MNKQQMRMTGIVCLVISAVCIFVAIERYNTNAGNVRGMNAMQQQSEQRMDEFQQRHFPPSFNNSNSNSNGLKHIPLKPGVPAATKYAIVFALISGIAGGILLKKSKG